MKIGIDSWIIQDGNYPDFKQGEIRQFALEFSPDGLRKSTNQVKECTWLSECLYRANAEVVYLEKETHPCTRVSGSGENRVETNGEYDETIVVLDLGNGVMVFDESHHDYYEKGGFVEGNIWVGIDPFFYKEGHCKRPGIPALTYTWKIEKIEMLTAPWVKHVEMHHGKERKVYRRDKTKIAYKEIDRTDAWEDDGCRASYVLTVSKQLLTPPDSADLAVT